MGKRGKTAYERLEGKKCKIEVVPLGETVMYKKLQGGERRIALESDWEEGVWLGHSRESSEILVGTVEGVVKAFAVRRRDEGQRGNGENIPKMTGM